jgi:hypothetical protein
VRTGGYIIYTKSFVSWKMIFKKWFFIFFYICLLLKRLVNEKYFSVKEKFSLIFRKIFSFYFGRKTLSRSYEKIRNIILFADYVKFGPQTFDCYIFCLNIFFSISSLKIWFNFIFILTLVLIFIIVIYFFSYNFFNWNFLSIKFSSYSFDCYLFYLK